jgi:sugar phosphate isomerase/epimerase
VSADKPAHPPAESLIHRGLGRVEFFDLTPERLADLQPLLDEMKAEGREKFSFHAPIARPDWFPYSGVTCFFLCEDEAKRETSFRLLGETLEAAKRWGAEYVVCHLTFGPTDSKDESTARKLAESALARFAAMSRAGGIPIDVEFAAYSDSFHRPDAFVELVGAHSELGVCLDIAHAYIGAQKRERDYWRDVETLAAKARSAHLWNTRGAEDAKNNGHWPLHPSQNAKDGWIDIERVVDMLVEINPNMSFICEYPVISVTPEINQGYYWVADLVGTKKRINGADNE